MGGPGAALLLPAIPTPEEIQQLKSWFDGVVESYSPSHKEDIRVGDGWDAYLRWPAELGKRLPDRACPVGMNLTETFPLDADGYSPALSFLEDLRPLEECLGWIPPATIDAYANCSQPCDYKLLGWLCLQLTERFDAWVWFGGPVFFDFKNYTTPPGVKGRLLTMMVDGWPLQIGDADFMRWWLHHPRFQMIK